MAQHDYVIANGTGAAVRSDLNNALSAIVTQNSGSTEPTTTYAYQMWADTNAGVMKIRNGANSAWITLYQLDGEWTSIAFENGSAAAPSIYFKDSGTDTGFFSGGTDQVNIATAGTERVEWGTSEVVFNDAGNNYDFRVEGDTNANLLFVDASADAVGIGTSSPSGLLDLAGTKNLSSDIGQIIVRDSASYATGVGGAVVLAGKYNSGGSYTAGAYLNARKENSTDGNYSFALGFGTIANGGAIGEKMTLDSSGRLGIGTSTFSVGTSNELSVNGSSSSSVSLKRGDSLAGYVGCTSSSMVVNSVSNLPLLFYTNDTERARIDSSGRLLVGTSSGSTSSSITVQGNSSSSTGEAILRLCKGNTSPSNGDELGQILFGDSNQNNCAIFSALRDGGTWNTSTSRPTRLVFSTTADGASSPTERMRITQAGIISNKTTNIGSVIGNGFSFSPNGWGMFTTTSEEVFYVNRQSADGVIISIRQDGNEEGTISVSGSTVSYNGAHLSRWSQLPGGAVREEILRGTVLSNIDEMCAWGEEDNEQLNRMQVSDVEGDPNVAGVFQAWDDDDDTYTNDFYCAMTGDFIIRISAGIPVHRGQLLMSAGDGTAKPQDDDIIRSKTIAKVTSTNVSCTYEDGSYCVPCVLMAC